MTATSQSRPLVVLGDASPALGLLELGSVARGMVVADAMVKQASLKLLRVEAVTPGKLLVLVSGREDDVKEGLKRGQSIGSESIIDRFYLPKADPQLAPAIMGALGPREVDALGIVETFSVASAILSADSAVKGAEVSIVRMRLARGLGGKAFYLLGGALEQLEVAMEVISESLDGAAMLMNSEIIPRPHHELIERIWTS